MAETCEGDLLLKATRTLHDVHFSSNVHFTMLTLAPIFTVNVRTQPCSETCALSLDPRRAHSALLEDVRTQPCPETSALSLAPRRAHSALPRNVRTHLCLETCALSLVPRRAHSALPRGLVRPRRPLITSNKLLRE